MMALIVVAALLLVLQLRRLPDHWFVRAERVLVGPAPLLVVALATFPLYVWFWGSFAPVPISHDEYAYLLQARLFASFRWAAETPPLPEFFEQYHVLLVPALAPKYPPGHALLLAPGVWFEAPALVPVLLCSATASLVFALARRLAGPWTALLTLIIWLGTPLNVWFRPSYFSGLTTTLLWLIGWYALLLYRVDPRARWMALLGLCVGWGGMTRPLTMVAFALPAAVAAIVLIARRQRWTDVPVALALTVAVCLTIPAWSHGVLGDPTTTPYAYYSKVYFPSDDLGFGVDSSPPLRSLPDDLQRHYTEFILPVHAAHTIDRLPHILRERLIAIGLSTWAQSFFLVGAAALALVSLTPALLLGLLSTLFLVAAYLLFAHPPNWALYYLETQPVLALLTALGLVRAEAVRVATARYVSKWRTAWAPSRSRVSLIPAAVGLVLVAELPTAYIANARGREKAREYAERFESLLNGIPEQRAIVFIRYAPGHMTHMSLVANDPDVRSSRVWRVLDRGADNVRLTRLAPERAVYLYLESDPIDPSGGRLLRIRHPESYFRSSSARTDSAPDSAVTRP